MSMEANMLGVVGNGITSADTIIKMTMLSDKDKRIRFETLVHEQLRYNKTDFEIRLPFCEFGGTYEDIQFIIDAGYVATKIIGLGYWCINIAKYKDTSIPQLTEEYSITRIVKEFGTLAKRRMDIFKREVDNQINKPFATPFLAELGITDFPDDASVAFIRDLGFVVERKFDDGSTTQWHSWEVTFPEDVVV